MKKRKKTLNETAKKAEDIFLRNFAIFITCMVIIVLLVVFGN
jgi:CHASE3 domain sensor protein